ncbi:MAG TPA: LysR substrate-binding domain-containing protein [Mycobacteriales bacterium]|nr:LysR substrate-binding domain-containing protein [Mycobacteriales bacterium]
MQVQIQQLRYVVAVAQERHFTRAAAKLHVAQPSLSVQVRALERELGAPLFDRTRGALGLTAAGEAFLPWARQALADLAAGQDDVRELLGLRRGRLAIGATPSLTSGLLPPLLARFHARYPGIDLILTQAGSRDLVARLGDGVLDLALLILPVGIPDITTIALAIEELVLAVAPDHPLAHRRRIRVAELAGVPLVMFRAGYDLREATFAACRAAGFTPELALEGGEMDGVLALAAAGIGAAVVPGSVVRAGGPLVAVRFTGNQPAVPRRTVGLAERAHRPRPAAVGALVDELTGMLASTGWPGAPLPGLTVLNPSDEPPASAPAAGGPTGHGRAATS